MVMTKWQEAEVEGLKGGMEVAQVVVSDMDQVVNAFAPTVDIGNPTGSPLHVTTRAARIVALQ